jgi:streptogramin lyase
LIFDPIEPNTLYLGTMNGNIFVSSDGGQSWTYVDRPLRHIWELAVDPFGQRELWASEDVVPTTASLTATVRSTNPSHTEWITVPYPGDPSFSSPTYVDFAPVEWGQALSGTVYLMGRHGEQSHMSKDNGQT